MNLLMSTRSSKIELWVKYKQFVCRTLFKFTLLTPCECSRFHICMTQSLRPCPLKPSILALRSNYFGMVFKMTLGVSAKSPKKSGGSQTLPYQNSIITILLINFLRFSAISCHQFYLIFIPVILDPQEFWRIMMVIIQ